MVLFLIVGHGVVQGGLVFLFYSVPCLQNSPYWLSASDSFTLK